MCCNPVFDVKLTYRSYTSYTSKRIAGFHQLPRTFHFSKRVIGSRASISGHDVVPCAAPFPQIWPNAARTSGDRANEWRRWSCSTTLWHVAPWDILTSVRMVGKNLGTSCYWIFLSSFCILLYLPYVWGILVKTLVL